MNKLALWLVLACVCPRAGAADRFISTMGSVQREVPADRVAMTLEVASTAKTIEASNEQLERQIQELIGQVAALRYPTTVLSLKLRSTRKATEYDETQKKWVPSGFESSATFGVNLVGLTNYGRFLTYIGTREGFRILWSSTSSSLEGDARKRAITEALEAARSKALLLAEEGNGRLGRVLEVNEEEVKMREFEGSTWSGNSADPNAGTGAYPIGIFVRVRAKFELLSR